MSDKNTKSIYDCGVAGIAILEEEIKKRDVRIKELTLELTESISLSHHLQTALECQRALVDIYRELEVKVFNS